MDLIRSRREASGCGNLTAPLPPLVFTELPAVSGPGPWPCFTAHRAPSGTLIFTLTNARRLINTYAAVLRRRAKSKLASAMSDCRSTRPRGICLRCLPPPDNLLPDEDRNSNNSKTGGMNGNSLPTSALDKISATNDSGRESWSLRQAQEPRAPVHILLVGLEFGTVNTTRL